MRHLMASLTPDVVVGIEAVGILKSMTSRAALFSPLLPSGEPGYP